MSRQRQGWWMFYDTLWALVLGFALSGAVQAFVSKRAMQRSIGDHRPRTRWVEDAAGYGVSDLTMLRPELMIGFVVEGFASVAVPVSVWPALFVTGHGLLSTIENVVVAPVLALISFVC